MLRASGSQSWCRPLAPQPLPGEGAIRGGTDHLPAAPHTSESLGAPSPLGLRFPSCDTGTVGLAQPKDDPGWE